MSDQPLNMLCLCTGNPARSILGEAIVRHDGDGRFKACSAGSIPTGTVNPWAFHPLKRRYDLVLALPLASPEPIALRKGQKAIGKEADSQ